MLFRSDEYTETGGKEKENTFLGKFIHGAIAHKGMVIDEIFRSKNLLAGFSKKRLIERIKR